MKRFFEDVIRQEKAWREANPTEIKKFKVSVQTVSCNIVDSTERKEGDEVSWRFPRGKPFWNYYAIEHIDDLYVILEGGIAIAYDKIVAVSLKKV